MRRKYSLVVLATMFLISLSLVTCNHKHVEIAGLNKSTLINAEPSGQSLCGVTEIIVTLLNSGDSAGDGIRVDFVLEPEGGGDILPAGGETVDGEVRALLMLNGSAESVIVRAIPSEDYPESQTSVILLSLIRACVWCGYEDVVLIDCAIDYPEADGTLVDVSYGPALPNPSTRCSLGDTGSEATLSCDYSPTGQSSTGEVYCVKLLPSVVRRFSAADFPFTCDFTDDSGNPVVPDCVLDCY